MQGFLWSKIGECLYRFLCKDVVGYEGLVMGSLDNKIAIIRAMNALMSNHSLEEIKTVDICSKAGISRQTFYRNFTDKYDAVIWFMEEGALNSVRQIGITCSWKTGHRRLFAFVSNNRKLIECFFRMKGVSALGKSIVEKDLELNFVSHYREQFEQATGNAPDSKIDFQIHAFAKMSMECIKEWQNSSNPDLSDEYIDTFISAIPRDLFEALDIEDKPDKDPAFIFPAISE